MGAMANGSAAKEDRQIVARKGPARLKDVAEATGFSINTVSLALRGSPRVPEATTLVVTNAARKLNYLPNNVARSLAERKTRQVGVVVTDLMNPLLTAAAQYIEMELAKSDYRTLIWGTNRSQESEIAALDLLRSGQVDGLIVYPVHHRELSHLVRLRKSGSPIVLLAGRADGIDTITSDDWHGARTATTHLIAAGHRRITFLASPTSAVHPDKASGYRAAMEEAGLAPHIFATGGFTPRDGQALVAGLLADHQPTAVIAASDLVAIGVLRGCRVHGIRVPDDLAVVGFDDIELAAFAEVPLTTIAYSAATVAERAVARMMTLVNSRDRLPEPLFEQIEPTLVVRESTNGVRER